MFISSLIYVQLLFRDLKENKSTHRDNYPARESQSGGKCDAELTSGHQGSYTVFLIPTR